MRLSSIHLHQFGGLVDQKIDFGKKLSTVVGNNDVGKSTLYHAIYHALLTPTALNKRGFEKELERFIPLGEGDHATVELQFSVDAAEYTLTKTWSAKKKTRSTELKLPTGATVIGDREVTEKLEELLPAAPGTVRTVLMTDQAGLGESLDEIDEETLHTLDDVLRATVTNTAGVSVARFEEELEQELETLGQNWDFEDFAPNRGRDHHNPWKRNVGEILKAYYVMGEAQQAHEEAVEAEDDLDEAAARYAEADADLREATAYLEEHKESYDALTSRAVLAAEIEALELGAKQTTTLYDAWTKAGEELSGLGTELPKLEKEEAALKAQRDNVEGARQAKKLRDWLSKAKQGSTALGDAREALAGVPAVSEEQLTAIQAAHDQVQQTQASLASGKLSLTFVAKKDQKLDVTRDLEEPKSERIFAHKRLEVEAEGRISLEHPEWDVTVISGTGDFDEIADRHQSAKTALAALLEPLELADAQAARKAHLAYTKLEGALARAEKNLAEILGQESLESLRAKVDGLGETAEIKDPDELIERYVRAQGKLTHQTARRDTLVAQVEKWTTEHGSRDQVLEDLALHKSNLKQAQEKLAELPGPPENVNDEDFKETYVEARETKDRLQENHGELKADLEVAKKAIPEVSSEELLADVQSAEREFDKRHARGQAILRIQRAMEEIGEAQSATYAGIRKEVEELFERLSAGRYAELCEEEEETALPASFLRAADEVEVPVGYMSHGMRDGVALASRLAMAKYFLEEAEGFLIMDDPLVNLDGPRQKVASEILTETAKKKQIVVFTCHETHAELLGGKRVVLEG